MFKYLSSMGFEYNVYSKGEFRFYLNNNVLEFGETEENIFEEINYEKLDALSKIFSVSDYFDINLNLEIKDYSSISNNDNIEKKIELLQSMLIYSIESYHHNNIPKIGLSFVVRGFNSTNEKGRLHLLEILKGLCNILNPLYANHVTSIKIRFFKDEDISFLPSNLEDIFFINKKILDKLGKNIVDKVIEKVESATKLNNEGIFFLLSSERLVKNTIFENCINEKDSISSFIYELLKKKS